MEPKNYIRLFAGRMITDSNLDKSAKYQLLNFVKESDIHDVMNLLMDGKIEPISEQAKQIVVERFKRSEIPNKIKFFAEQEAKKIDKDDVKQAAWKVAKKVHGKPDKKIVDDIVNKAIKKGKDTEDAIQIATNMLSSDE